MNIDSFKIRIMAARQGQRLADLAEKADLTAAGLQGILKRETASDISVVKLAAALGVEPQEIIKEES